MVSIPQHHDDSEVIDRNVISNHDLPRTSDTVFVLLRDPAAPSHRQEGV